MGQQIQDIIQDMIFQLTEIQASDILAHADVSKKELFPIQLSKLEDFTQNATSDLNHVLKIATQNKRETDTQTLCLAIQTISWNYKGKTVSTPLILCPLEFSFSKQTQVYHFKLDTENFMVNPFFRNELLRSYELELLTPTHEDLASYLNYLQEFLAQYFPTCTISPHQIIGNFHYHRYQIVKDLDALLLQDPNELVREILGESVDKNNSSSTLSDQLLVPADKDQRQIFTKINAGNLVIQGPPGTGKTQVLTNIIGKYLNSEKMTLVVSEKKVALEVLVQKLKSAQLDPFSVIIDNQTKPKALIQQLKKSWEFLERSTEIHPSIIPHSELLLSNLQLQLDKLSHQDLVGGVSLETFNQLLDSRDLETAAFDLQAPSIATWLQYRETVHELHTSIGSFEELRLFKKEAFLQQKTFMTSVEELIQAFQAWEHSLRIDTLETLETCVKQIPRCQLFENEYFKKYASIYKSKKAHREFEKLRIQFYQHQGALQLWENEANIWKNQVSKSELESWKNALETGNWFQKRRVTKQVKNQLTQSEIDPIQAINNQLELQALKQDQQAVIAQFFELGIERPEIELEGTHYFFQQLQKEALNEINSIEKLPAEMRKQLLLDADRLQQAYQFLRQVFNLTPSSVILEVLQVSKQKMGKLIQSHTLIEKIPIELFRLISRVSNPSELELFLLKSNWIQFESTFPEIAKLNGTLLKSKIEAILTQTSLEEKHFADQILEQKKTKFNAYNTLLRTYSTKLNADQKILKQRLKAGKAILVREFSKTKQYKTMRELLDSEAKIWIELLTPIWLSTPSQVAANFPMEKSLFETVIFDEASQIPLESALGSLQRSNKAIVAGDSQQMSPSHFFNSSRSTVDLLHQANFYYPKSSLKHHYRSKHPNLIAFSNRFFYENELIVYPSPIQDETSLKLHWIEDGVFENRQNPKEAKAVAQAITHHIQSNSHVGIVAFSESQLQCIWNQLTSEVQDKLALAIEQNTAFFNTLEQVQGDECAILLISLGYGKDPNGEFHLRLGPLNQKSGGKRLNVLFSRAQERIELFTSLKSSDFKLSENENINLLKYALQMFENSTREEHLQFPFGLHPLVVENQTLLFKNIAQQLPDAMELVTMHRVLTARGWKISYQI